MDQKRITPVTTAGCFAGVMLILALLSTYVPFFSIVGYFIMPIPIAIIYMKFGARWAIMMGAVVGLLMGMFINPAAAVIQLIAFGGVGVALGAGFRHDWSPGKLLMGVTLALAVTFVVAAGAMYVFMDFNVWNFMQDQFKVITDAVLASYADGGMNEIQLAQTKEQLNQILVLLPSVIPLIFLMGLSMLSYLNIKIAQMVLTALGYEVRPFLPIRYWEIPRIMLYLYVLAMVCKYWGSTRDIALLNIAGLNLEALTVFFISIQGVAFMLFLLGRRFRLSTPMQAVIVGLSMLIPIFQLVAFIAGMVDMIMGYRKKHSVT